MRNDKEDPFQPSLQREGVASKHISINISPLLRGVRRGLIALPLPSERVGVRLKK